MVAYEQISSISGEHVTRIEFVENEMKSRRNFTSSLVDERRKQFHIEFVPLTVNCVVRLLYFSIIVVVAVIAVVVVIVVELRWLIFQMFSTYHISVWHVQRVHGI